jgi:hypothetical protein
VFFSAVEGLFQLSYDGYQVFINVLIDIVLLYVDDSELFASKQGWKWVEDVPTS